MYRECIKSYNVFDEINISGAKQFFLVHLSVQI